MRSATAVKDVLGVLRGTSLGKKVAREIAAAESAREARVTARARYDEAAGEREQIPALAAAVEKAQVKYGTELDRLAEKMLEAQRAYSSVAGASSRKHDKAERHLRQTAHPLVHDHGPVVSAIEDALVHLRRHMFLVGDEERVRRTAKLAPLSDAREDREFIENARDSVRHNDEALELADAFRFALDEVRDLQLDVDVDLAAVRAALEDLPSQCVGRCPVQFTFGAALAAASEPKEIV